MSISRRTWLAACGIAGVSGIGFFLLKKRHSNRFQLRPSIGRIKYFPCADLAETFDTDTIRTAIADIVSMQKRKDISPDIHVHLVKLLPMVCDLFPNESDERTFFESSLEYLLVQSSERRSALQDKLFLRTPFGVAYRTTPQTRPLEYFTIATGMSHRDAALESFVEIEMPLSTELRFDDGTIAHVRELLNDSISRFSIHESDLEWSATAYSYLFQPESSWLNKNQEKFDFFDLARHLNSTINTMGPCYGTHRIIAIAHLVISGALGNGKFREKMTESIRNVCRILESNQCEVGSWSRDYLFSPTYGKYPQGSETPVDVEFNITCHVLEFLSLIPDEYFQTGEKFRMANRATGYFLKNFRVTLYGGLERNVASTCHGIRAIYHLTRKLV